MLPLGARLSHKSTSAPFSLSSQRHRSEQGRIEILERRSRSKRKERGEREKEKCGEKEILEVATENQEEETGNSRLQLFLSSLFASIGGVFGHYQEEEEDELEMASKTVVPHGPIRGDENKHRKGGNRRALQEIGNLVSLPHGEGKPQTQITCPITKSLDALSLAANDRAAAEKNIKNKKEEEEVIDANSAVNRVVARDARQPKAVKKVTYKEEPETLIIISSDEREGNDESKKDKGFSGSKGSTKHGSSRKKAPSLTSILTARSQAACGLATIKPKEHIVTDIDAGDANNELAVVEYVDDIYQFYKLTEDENQIGEYMHLQSNINPKMRMILIDWLVEVHNKFELLPETLYLTIDVVDRFLSRKFVSRMELQLVGISSMLLACKYEEIWAPEVNDFVSISDRAYTRQQVLSMEKSILEKLEWNLTVATPYVFLVRFIKATVPSDKEMENMAFFLAETGLMYYAVVVSYRPSLIAAAAVYAALRTLNRTPAWTETLKHYTGYSEDQLKECAKMLIRFHAAGAADNTRLKAVYKKFKALDRGSVALFPPAKIDLLCSP
ncbi:hypothetical protein Nepgr_012173 [Nepenthes gracilis]|uniref:Cyclin N-terminal domain-containing protein n=1 Tax=Nepenthes gracilis TaxID=150966 RepID=A0AAD3XML0_NEPGR|nr:hypothetical protein Nepgr_012173 [Nepenthes gracilis]